MGKSTISTGPCSSSQTIPFVHRRTRAHRHQIPPNWAPETVGHGGHDPTAGHSWCAIVGTTQLEYSGWLLYVTTIINIPNIWCDLNVYDSFHSYHSSSYSPSWLIINLTPMAREKNKNNPFLWHILKFPLVFWTLFPKIRARVPYLRQFPTSGGYCGECPLAQKSTQPWWIPNMIRSKIHWSSKIVIVKSCIPSGQLT
jgi:hypothetical protein